MKTLNALECTLVAGGEACEYINPLDPENLNTSSLTLQGLFHLGLYDFAILARDLFGACSGWTGEC